MEAFMNALATIAGVFAFGLLVALVIERLVEKFVKPPLQRREWDEATPYVALFLGALFSGAFAIDLFTPLALAVGLQPFVPWAGYLLTGLAIGGGSNLLHDVWPGSNQATLEELQPLRIRTGGDEVKWITTGEAE